jgi:hypothetical protein
VCHPGAHTSSPADVHPLPTFVVQSAVTRLGSQPPSTHVHVISRPRISRPKDDMNERIGAHRAAVRALDNGGSFGQSALMSETAGAARFGAAMKALGVTFYWVAGFAAVIAFIANRHLRFEPFLKYGLPALIVVVGIVAGSLLRAPCFGLPATPSGSWPNARRPPDSTTFCSTRNCRTGAGQDPPLWSQTRSVLRGRGHWPRSA